MLEIQPVDKEREAYLAQKRAEAMIVPHGEYEALCGKYLGIRHIIAPAILHAQAFRFNDGDEFIIIDYDQFQSGFGQDFTSMIPYAIEHEAQELWLTRENDTNDLYGPAHYEATRQTLLKAHRDGNLDMYLTMERSQMKTFEAMGCTRAMEELDFYVREAQILQGH